MKSKAHLIIGTLSAVEISLLMGLSLNPITVATAAFLSVAPDIDEPNSKVLDKLVSKKTTKKIHSTLIFTMLIACFYLYTKTEKSVYIGVVLSLIAISFIEKKITVNHTRSIILTLVMLLISTTLLIYNVNAGIVVLSFLIALFPITNHRSLTHSALIVVLIFSILKYIEYSLHIKDLAIIASTALISHLLCDIVTKRGIPIFYPFSKKYFSLANLRVGSFLCNLVEYLVIIILSILILVSFLKKLNI